MQDVIIMELESNMSFRARIDNPPGVTQNYTTVYMDEKQVKRLNIEQTNGLINMELMKPSDSVVNFIKKWNLSRKRINLMLETSEHMYLIKGCSVKRFNSDDNNTLTVFYNTFKEA